MVPLALTVAVVEAEIELANVIASDGVALQEEKLKPALGLAKIERT